MIDDRIELNIPPEPEYVFTARLFAASVGRQLGLEEESVADIKLAVSEACNGAIQSRGDSASDEPIRIFVRPNGTKLLVEIAAATGQPPGDEPWNPTTPAELFQPSVGLSLIQTLFPDAEFIGSEGGGVTIRFSATISKNAA